MFSSSRSWEPQASHSFDSSKLELELRENFWYMIDSRSRIRVCGSLGCVRMG